MLAGRNYFELDGPFGNIVDALFGDQSKIIAVLGCFAGFSNMPTGEIRGAIIDNFSRSIKLFETLPNLLPRNLPSNMVHLVEIDVISL